MKAATGTDEELNNEANMYWDYRRWWCCGIQQNWAMLRSIQLTTRKPSRKFQLNWKSNFFEKSFIGHSRASGWIDDDLRIFSSTLMEIGKQFNLLVLVASSIGELDDDCLTWRQLLGVARDALDGQLSNKFNIFCIISDGLVSITKLWFPNHSFTWIFLEKPFQNLIVDGQSVAGRNLKFLFR